MADEILNPSGPKYPDETLANPALMHQQVPTQDAPTPNEIQPVGESSQPQPQPVARDENGMSPDEAAMMPKGQPQQPQKRQGGGMFHAIMETLAGPQFSYKVDPETGQMVKTPVQRKTSQLANSIVAGALTGLFSGMGERGPGAAGRAASKGFAASMGNVMKQDEAAQAQAKEDFGRKASILETNMRMYQNQFQLSTMDYNMHKLAIDNYAPMLKSLRDIPGAVAASGIPEHELKSGKYNFTETNAVPDGVAPMLDENGNQMTDPKTGHKLWENTYSVINPTKLEVPEDLKKKAVEWGLPGFTGGDGKEINLPSTLQMKSQTAINTAAKVQAYEQAQHDLDRFTDYMNGTTGGKNYEGPELKDKALQEKVDAAAERNGVPKALLRAMITQESSENPKATSKKGAMGLLQLMPGTAKELNVTDPYDIDQNLDAGARYIKQQLDKYDGKIDLALAAYNAGPNNVTDHVPVNGETEGYVKNIMSNLKEVAPSDEDKKFQNINLKEMVRKDPRLARALEIRYNQGLVGLTPDKAVEAMAKNPETAPYAGTIAALYGGPEALKDYTTKVDAANKLAQTKAELEAKTQAKLDEKEKVSEADRKRIIANNEELISALANHAMINVAHITSLRNESSRQVIVNEVMKRNPDWNPEEVNEMLRLFDDAGAGRANSAGSFANSVSNANTSLGHMGGALRALDKLAASSKINLNDASFINKTVSELNSQFGTNTDWTSFKVALHTAATDWQNLLNNQHALTESDKEVAKEVSDPKATIGNILSGLQEMAHTAAIRIVPLNDRWKRTFNTDFPDLLNNEAIDAIRRINNPEVTRLLGDMKTGGTITRSRTGGGSGGRPVNEVLKEKGGTQQQNQPQGRPVYKDGQLIGYTQDGKTMTPVNNQAPPINRGSIQ